jgi:hypothetical protein
VARARSLSEFQTSFPDETSCAAGIVNLADPGHPFAARLVAAGQHNRRAKDHPTRAAAPPTQRAYHGRLS